MHTEHHLGELVEQSIRELLSEYIAHPLRYMREINLQFRLGELILENMKNAGLQIDSSVEVFTQRSSYETADKVRRIQHELKIDVRGNQVPDIVVLRAAPDDSRIRLKREKGGHLDIIASVRATDVAAVVELKAACSRDPDQRHLFRMDVQKLLEIQQLAAKAEGLVQTIKPTYHFVLIDKSISVGNHNSLGPQAAHVDAWHEGVSRLQYKNHKTTGEPMYFSSPQLEWAQIDPKVAIQRGVVHVWDIGDDAAVRLRYCGASRDVLESDAHAQGLKSPSRRSPRQPDA